MSYDPDLFNTDPYYDDFSESKKFLRLMFRPGYAVQARELTQLQTVLQNQIERFGNHVFEDGSMVLNGQISENYVKYARVSGLSGTSNIRDFIGTTVRGTNTAPATVIHAEAGLSAGDTNGVLFFEYTTGATAFAVNTVLGATSSTNTTINLTITGNYAIGGITANALGNCVLINVDDGVRYVDGFFVYHDSQKIAACTLTGTAGTEIRLFDNPTCSIGFNKQKTFVSAEDDSSLNDPAFGYYNYAAPGSDRYKIDLVVSRNKFDPNSAGTTSGALSNFARSDYLEFIRVVDGYTIKKELYPDYSVIEDTLARRTYDESGNYTVKPFDLNLEDGTTASTISAVLSPGKAYVFGYEFETQAPSSVQLDKARDTVVQPSTQFPSVLGSFAGGTVGINTNMNFINIEQMPEILLSSSVGTGAYANIGTARVRGLERTTATNTNIYLFDISMSGGATFGAVRTAFIPGYTTGGQQLFNFKQTAGRTILEGGGDSLLWPVPSGKAVKTINDVDYNFTTHFNPVSCVGGSGAISLTSKTGLYAVNQTRFPSVSVSTAFPEPRVRLYGMSGHELSGTFVSTAAGMTFSGLTITGSVYSGNVYAIISTIADYDTVTGYKKRTKTFTTQRLTITGSGANAYQGFRFDKGSQPYFFLSDVRDRPNIDVIRVLAITGAYGGVANQNLNQYFTLDTGQRDAYYDWSRLVLAPGLTESAINPATGLSAPFVVTLEKFVHGADYGTITVDSYITGSSFSYENIPSYTSPKTGIKYELRDVIDFRPGRTGSIPSATGTSITGSFYSSMISMPDGANQFSYTHHLPRTDKIVLTRNRNFAVVKGVSDPQANVPQDNPDAMTLYTVTLNPYTFSSSDASTRYYNNRRYTMKDIGDLEKRINSVEYYTTLSILEQEAKALEIIDAATNLQIPKKGILVDSFRGHNIGDVQDSNYNAAIDYENTLLRPAFINRVYRLGITGNGSNIIVNGYSGVTADNTTTISYTLSPQISQPIATTSVTVNPIGVSNFLGSMRIYPSSDFWYDDSTNPIVKVNIDGENDNWESICARSGTGAGKGKGFGTQYNDWESNWSGRNRIDENTVLLNNKTPSRSVDAKLSGVNFGNSNLSILPETLRATDEAVTENKVIRKDILPYARNITIAFTAEGLKPNTTMYAFLDGKGMSGGRLYEMSSSGVLGSTVTSMTTNSSGKLVPSSGGYYAVRLNPGSSPLISTGSKLLRVTDSASDTKTSTTTAAEQLFFIEGTYGEKTNNISSTRKPMIRRESVASDDVITNIFARENQRSGLVQLKGMIDPLSQSFTVNGSQYPSGIMIKKLGLFFKTKPSDSSPITVLIKPTVNGYPHPSKVLPFGIATLYPSSINTSVDGNSGNNPETLFEFTSPVYLLPGKEYTISVLTNNTEYSLFTAVNGNPVLSDETKNATKQPYVGSMFKAQNASTLMKIDNESIKFILYACDFTSSGSGYIDLTTGIDSSAVYGSNINIDEMRMSVPVLLPPNTTISFAETTSPSLGLGSIMNEKNVVLSARKTATPSTSSFFTVRATIATTNRWVSPFVDYDRANVYAIENLVTSSPSTESLANVINTANSRYITKKINLQQNANNLNVYLSVNNKYPSSIDVYYRYLPASSDSSIVFDDQNYILMSKISGSDYTKQNEYRELQFGVTGATAFNTFGIKVVMKSSDGTVVPRIQNMRIVAT
jgi:hypothetical protein